jgi:hypothetical protein
MRRELGVPGTYYQHALSQHIERLVVSRIGPIFLSAGTEPLPEKDALRLVPENFLRKIEVAV